MSNVLQQWMSALGLAPKPNRQRVFISYRRRDSSGYAGRLADRIVKEFGDDQCFRDVEDIESGTDFVQAIEQAVGSCDALVVVIGPDWLNVKDNAGNRRLDDPRDFVRLEIAAALQRDIRVIPVLVGEADMPTAEQLPSSINRLAYRQAVEITDSRWDYDVGRLVATLESMGIPRAGVKNPNATPNYRKRLAAAGIGFVLLVSGAIGGAALVVQPDPNPNPAVDPQPYEPVKPDNNDPAPSPVVNNDDNRSQPRTVQDNRQRDVKAQPSYESIERPRVLQSLVDGDHVSGEALRTHNTGQLAQYFTGAALVEQLAAVQVLVAAGAHVHATIHDRNVRSVRINGDQAVVDQVLDYDIEFRNPQEQCVQRVPRHSSEQTITLLKQNGRWLVAHENVLTQSEPQACY